MTRRIPQVESTLQRAIAQVLQRHISDPRIEGMVSITRVKVSPDLHEAYIYVSVLPAESQRKTLQGLRHAASHIHALTSRLVAMRTVPRFDFRLDESLKKEAAVHDAIQQGLARSGNPDQSTSDSQSSSPDPAEDQAS